jgi:hypothetical protein
MECSWLWQAIVDIALVTLCCDVASLDNAGIPFNVPSLIRYTVLYPRASLHDVLRFAEKLGRERDFIMGARDCTRDAPPPARPPPIAPRGNYNEII